MSFSLKYQKELFVENKPEGNKFWFSMMYAYKEYSKTKMAIGKISKAGDL